MRTLGRINPVSRAMVLPYAFAGSDNMMGWLAVAFVLLPGGPVAAQFSSHECRISGEPVRCGTLRVPENPDHHNGRQLALSIIVAPRRRAGEAKEPLFVLKGGPGQRATSDADDMLEALGAVRDDRDIVLLDQRGTGGEGRLECDVADRAFLVPRDPDACLRGLAAKADLRQYSTDRFVQDLEAARAALGYDRISMWAASYGTRAAYVYARRYPHRVRSLVLIAPAPISMAILDSFEEDGHAALDALVDDCLSDGECARAFPALRADTQKALEQATDSFDRFGLQALQYSSATSRFIPLLLTQAAAGNREPLAAAIREVHRQLIPQLALGLHLAVFCSEDLPFHPSQGLAPASFFRLEYERACRGWPQAEVREDFHSAERVGAAALVIVGQWDPVTSPRWAHVAAEQFAASQVVIVPKQGHILAGFEECLAAMTDEFLDRSRANPSCAIAVNRLRYAVRP